MYLSVVMWFIIIHTLSSINIVADTGNTQSHAIPRTSTVDESQELLNSQDLSMAESRRRCGITCLYFFVKYYGLDLSYDQLLSMLQPTDFGVSMLAIKEVAEGIGFETKAVQLSLQDVLKFGDPFIVYIPPNSVRNVVGHFVVFVPKPEKKGHWIIDVPRKARWIEPLNIPVDEQQVIDVLLLRPIR